ncbi:MAG: DEAD/DEAH box helicase [Bacteroidales bacterium]|jgi:ATP-dependent RNA helicase RhlE|nr:DEAD/DEAH box helicase [Bacteroidales bacterium]
MTFKELNIIEPVLKALIEKEYTIPTPIQEKAIPVALQNRDLLGCARTGTGKTAAFAIPVIQNLLNQRSRGKGRSIEALVLTPTRELALQISDNFTSYARYTHLKHGVVFGGVNQNPQINMLAKGIDILIATPGRLLDLINQGYVHLDKVRHFVLDEADRMLDMGFIRDIRKIMQQLPVEKQTLFFSATMPPDIVSLSQSILHDPVKIEIIPEPFSTDTIEQFVYFVEKKEKGELLISLLEKNRKESVLVFSRTKHGADKIARSLCRAGIGSEAIHGNKTQNARQRTLANFKTGKTRVMIATDVVSRGIDIDELPLVINYDLPDIPETYVHRIGRTGRAGKSGKAFSFCSLDEKSMIRDIQKLTGRKLNMVSSGSSNNHQ